MWCTIREWQQRSKNLPEPDRFISRSAGNCATIRRSCQQKNPDEWLHYKSFHKAQFLGQLWGIKVNKTLRCARSSQQPFPCWDIRHYDHNMHEAIKTRRQAGVEWLVVTGYHWQRQELLYAIFHLGYRQTVSWLCEKPWPVTISLYSLFHAMEDTYRNQVFPLQSSQGRYWTWLPVSKLCSCVMLAVFQILTVLSTVPPSSRANMPYASLHIVQFAGP